MMKNFFNQFFGIPSIIFLWVSNCAMGATTATLYNITVLNQDGHAFTPTINTWSGYYGDDPPQTIPDHDSDTFTYNAAAVPTQTEAFLGPTITYRDVTNSSRGCVFGFTWDDSTNSDGSPAGCKVYVSSSLPSAQPQAPQVFCDGTVVHFDPNTATCTIQFTIY